MEILGIVDVPNWIIFIAVLVGTLYIYGSWYLDTFTKLGIKGPKPLPLLGNLLPLVQKGFLEVERECFKKYGKVFGLFEAARTPVLAICDAELVKEITVKQSHIFADRRIFIQDEFTKDFLTNLRAGEWKHVRNTVSPTFSSGKLKAMIGQINSCCRDLVKNIKGEIQENPEVVIRDFTGGYTMDVIASTGFGIQVDSQKDKNNEFVKFAKKAFDFNFGITLMLIMMFPEARSLFEYFGVKVFPEDSLRFFTQVAQTLLRQREESKDKTRTDFIQLMANSHREVSNEEGTDTTSTKAGITESQILAQSVLFFVAGYETTASAIAFLLFSLATNPECQDKVFEEIESVGAKEGDVTFEMLHEMQYLERAINETQRMYPAAIRTDRVATQDTEACGIKIRKGLVIAVDIYNLHYDPEVWPEPTKYDPDRFTEEEKAKRSPYSFCPFGVGPRTCIGMRLALLEIKCAAIYILRNFRVSLSEKTKVPLKFKKLGILQTESALWLKLEERK